MPKMTISQTHSYSGSVPFRADPWCLCWGLQRGKVRLFGREIIFQEFQPIWPRYTSTSQTDGRTDNLPWQ